MAVDENTHKPERRIGVAPEISVPSDFDDIDSGTEALFGLEKKKGGQGMTIGPG